jgi:hypothetical protein
MPNPLDAVKTWIDKRCIAALTVPCDGTCGSADPHDAHLNADWNGRTWVPRTWPWSRMAVSSPNKGRQ